MFSLIDWKTFLFIILGVLVLSGIFYFKHLQGKVSDLETELRLKEQKKQALAGSLEVLRKNYRDSLGNLRELRSRVNTPVDEDERLIDNENIKDEIGEAKSKTETTFSLKSDSVSGKSVGEKRKKYWKHDITKSTGLYNFNVHLKVWPPGDSLDYTISASTNEIKLRFFQYEDGSGIQRTGVDSPVGLEFKNLDTYYRPEPPKESGSEFENVKFKLPFAKASTVSGLTMGGEVVYRTNTFFGVRVLLEGGVWTPIPGAPQPRENIPTVIPEVGTGFTF